MRHALRSLLLRIDDEMRRTAGWTGRERLTPAVREALVDVPRHLFVPKAQREAAYDNRPLPIGHGQTISQPFIVALMTELLDPAPDKRALEIGTGCGYACAVLAQVFGEVHSVEVVPELAATARERLARQGCDNVQVHIADGSLGWPGAAPYDAISVTAATPEIPEALLEQLAVGGRMILPLGEPGGGQELTLVTRPPEGGSTSRAILPVAFVPLVSRV